MPFASGYRGTVNGSVQTTYTDQPGEGVAGMLAFASDLNLCDAVYIGEADGIPAGRAVIFTDVVDATSLQRPNVQAEIPALGTLVLADIAGVLVFDEHMQSDENGVPGWAQGRIGRVLRPVRAGGRIYVPVKDAVDHTADSVFVCVLAGTDAAYEGGEFLPAALAGTALAGYTVEMTNARWVTSAVAGGIACLEFIG